MYTADNTVASLKELVKVRVVRAALLACVLYAIGDKQKRWKPNGEREFNGLNHQTTAH